MGVLDLFGKSETMRPPSRVQCAAMFKAAGGVRNSRLARERFLRYFEDPRKEQPANVAETDGLRSKYVGVVRDNMGLVADPLSLRDDDRVAQSGAIFAKSCERCRY